MHKTKLPPWMFDLAFQEVIELGRHVYEAQLNFAKRTAPLMIDAKITIDELIVLLTEAATDLADEVQSDVSVLSPLNVSDMKEIHGRIGNYLALAEAWHQSQVEPPEGEAPTLTEPSEEPVAMIDDPIPPMPETTPVEEAPAPVVEEAPAKTEEPAPSTVA